MKGRKTAFEPTLDRREFTAQTVLALLSGVVVTVSSGCGDDDDDNNSPTGPSPTGGDATGTVSANHGHRAVITSAQLAAGNAVMLSIRGDADHPHTVELSAAEVMQVAAGQRVSKPSSADASHSHTVTFNA